MVGGITDLDDQLLDRGFGFERIRYVEAEGDVAASVRAELPAVQARAGFPVDRAEMEQDPATAFAIGLGQRERAAVPQDFVRPERLLYPG